MELSKEQNEVIACNGNVVVSAGAGAGKTRVLVEKILYDIKNTDTYKTIAAITFTIKAAKEIKNRLPNLQSNIFVGTNNAFVISEIIQPFFHDIHGKEYKAKYDTDYSKESKKDNYEECLEYLKTNKVITTLKNSSSNFIFKLAYEIISKSKIAQRYIKNKYSKWYIDEYQDTDDDMAKFFMFAKNTLGIELFVVGDEKQCIYAWRGAKPQNFSSLFTDETFTHKMLTANFRSTQHIQNLANILNESTHNLIVINDSQNDVFLMYTQPVNYKSLILNICNDNVNIHTAVLCKTNADAEDYANYLNINEKNFIYVPETPIDNISTGANWLYQAVAEYCLKKQNPQVFNNNIPSETLSEDKRETAFADLKKMLLDIYNSSTNKSEFSKKFKLLAEFLSTKIEETETDNNIEKLFNTITTKNLDGTLKYRLAFSDNETRNQVMTVDASKGREFDLIITFAATFSWNGNVEDANIRKMYVAITRAKKKLVVISETIKTEPIYLFMAQKVKTINETREPKIKLSDLAEYVDKQINETDQ